MQISSHSLCYEKRKLQDNLTAELMRDSRGLILCLMLLLPFISTVYTAIDPTQTTARGNSCAGAHTFCSVQRCRQKKQMKTQLYIIHGAGKRTLHLQVLEIRRAGRADNTIVSSEHKIVSASLAFPDLPSSLRRAGDPSVLFTRHATHG
jgi:hypothetical protein